MTEIPHRWYLHDRECEMVGPIVGEVEGRLKVVALEVAQDGDKWIVCLDADGNYPGLTYELIH